MKVEISSFDKHSKTPHNDSMGSSAFEMPQINLVQKKGAYIDTILHWALTTGRLIIIITETVALSAFAMRFSLDRQIIDLHDKIKQEEAIVNLLKHNEDTYRNLQDRLSLISTLDTQAQKENHSFFSLLSLIPQGVQLNRFQLSGTQLQLDINTNTTTTLATFIQTLKSQPNIVGLSIDKIENNISSGTIAITITAILKPNS